MDWKYLVEIEMKKLARGGTSHGYSKYPEFLGNYDELQDIPQMDWRIVTADNEKPVLATSGLANCIGVVAYDSQRGLAFLSHSDAFTCSVLTSYRWDPKIQNHVPEKMNGHVRNLYRELMGIGGEFSLDVKMIIGDPDKEMIDITKRTIENVPSYIKLSGLERVDMGCVGSIAIDARTGQLFTYDPRKNPNPQTKGVWDRMKL